MAVPKKRTPAARRDRRRSHHALKPAKLATCPQCQAPTRTHQACPNCGFYRGRDILQIESKNAKLAAKKKARKARQKSK